MATVALGTAALTGCATETYEQPTNPAAEAEITALSVVADYNENPESFDPETIDTEEILPGDGISSAVGRYLDENTPEEWDGDQKNINNGVVNVTAGEVYARNPNIQPGQEVVIYRLDPDGDGVPVAIYPVGVKDAD